MTKTLEAKLRGSWELMSRIDRTRDGRQVQEPSLGSDPIAFLVFDKTGHFAAQFMKRDRSNVQDSRAAGSNNSLAVGGYDAYFGTYEVDEPSGNVKTLLIAALSPQSVGQTFARHMQVDDDILTLDLDTTTSGGEPVHRTLKWRRIA